MFQKYSKKCVSTEMSLAPNSSADITPATLDINWKIQNPYSKNVWEENKGLAPNRLLCSPTVESINNHGHNTNFI